MSVSAKISKMVPPILVGKYNFESADNVDEYLKGLGVGLVLRKVQSVARPTVEISFQADSNQWIFMSESVFKTKKITFKPLEKFDDETYDSRKCQTSVEISEDGEWMSWDQICEEGPDVKTTIIATDNGFNMSMKSGEFACKLHYRRQTSG